MVRDVLDTKNLYSFSNLPQQHLPFNYLHPLVSNDPFYIIQSVYNDKVRCIYMCMCLYI